MGGEAEPLLGGRSRPAGPGGDREGPQPPSPLIAGLEELLARPPAAAAAGTAGGASGGDFDCCFAIRGTPLLVSQDRFCAAMCAFCDVPAWDDLPFIDPRLTPTPAGNETGGVAAPAHVLNVAADCYKKHGGIRTAVYACPNSPIGGHGFDPTCDPPEAAGSGAPAPGGADLRAAVLAVFLHMLEKLHCTYEIERGTADAEMVFVKVRMTELGLRVAAHFNQYGLQLEAAEWGGDRLLGLVDADTRGKSRDPAVEAPHALFDLRTERRVGRRVFRRYSQEPPDGSLFRQIDRIRLLAECVARVFHVAALEPFGVEADWFPLHSERERDRMREWSRMTLGNILKNAFRQTLDADAIRGYLGEEYALYFSWLTTYTHVLVYIAIPGVIVGTMQLVKDYDLEFNDLRTNVASLIFSGSVACWMAIMATRWADVEALLSVRWGTSFPSGAQRISLQLPEFKSQYFTRDPVRPWRLIKQVKKFTQNVRWSFILLLTSLVIAAVAVVVNGDFHEVLLNWVVYGQMRPPDDDATYWATVMTLLPAMVTAVLVKIADVGFSSYSEFAIDVENWQYADDQDDSHIAKRFAFSCLDYFSALLYLGLIKRYIWKEDFTANFNPMLRQQLLCQWLIEIALNFLEIWTPKVLYWQRTRKFGRGGQGGPRGAELRGAERDYYLPTHEGTLEEYMEMVTQVGLVTLFSLVLPFIPLCVWASNQWELLLDCDKVLHSYRRPFPREVRGIGAWNKILRIMSWVVMNLNFALCIFSTVGRQTPLLKQVAYLLLISVIGLLVREAIYTQSRGKKKALNLRVQSLLLKDAIIAPELVPAASPIAVDRSCV